MTAKNIPFSFDQLVKQSPVAIDLSRHQFLLIREGGRDMSAWSKAIDKVRAMAKTLPKDPDFDSVQEVRNWRTGAVD